MLTQILLIQLGIAWISVISGSSLVEIKFNEGEIKRNAEPGSQVFFDAPLRANRQNPSQVMISVANEIASDTFGVFPTVLSPGDPFTLILRDSESIPVMEKDNIFEVPFTVAQLNSPNETEKFSLFVKLLPSESELPRIWKNEQNFKLSQRLTNGIVGKIGIKNLEKTDLNLFDYVLFGGFSELFSIETAKEGLFLRTFGCSPEFCIQLPEAFTLLLRITPKMPMSMLNETEIALLHFQISRENLLGPHFSQREYDATIYEKSAYFLETVQLEAADSDYHSSSELSQSQIIFSLSEPSEIFQIDSLTGVLSVKNGSLITIDRLGEKIKLMAEVKDGKNPADMSEITIKILKEQKEETYERIEGFEFEQQIYAFAVNPKQTKVGKVSLMNDQKGLIRIVEGGAGNFGINENNGELFYNGPLERIAKNYTLKILAIPSPHSPTVALTIAQILVAGIGTHLPVFTEPFETLIVNYTTKPETKIHQLHASDSDKNAALVFTIESSSSLDFLSNPIQFNDEFVVYPNGEIIVKELSSNLMSTTLNVSVQDKSHKLESKDYAQIVIIIQHQKPVIDIEGLFNFEKLESPLIIADDLPIGTYIFTTLLNPLSHENNNILKPNITYSIINNNGRFKIEQDTGMIYTLSLLKHIGLQNLTILAEISTTKGTHKINTIIQIDAISMDSEIPKLKNDETELKLEVKENSPIQTQIGQINTVENEDGELFYEIIGNVNDLVEVDNRGRILVKKDIDFEIVKEILFFVNISNSLEKFVILPVSIKVINVNDEKPIFVSTETKFSTFENAPIQTYLGSMIATDKDGDRLSYSINFPENSPILGIFKFTVFAKDGENTVFQECELTIIATSRCQPIFAENQEIVFEVKESINPGSQFGTIKATSEDSNDCDPLLYHLQFLNDNSDSNSTTEVFKLDSTSGILSTYSSLQNYVNLRFPIVISASSGNLFTRKSAEIRIISTKSQPPSFPQKHLRIELFENNGANISLGSFKALPSNFGDEIYYKLENSFDETFSIDSEDGIIYVLKSLDREEKNLYRLNVIASVDKDFIDGLTDTTVINIVVNDLNDNGPRFEKDFYEMVLDSETLPGKEVFSVQAKDRDTVSKESISYKIENVYYKNRERSAAIFNGIFEIKQDSGKIRVLKDLKDFSGGLFEVSISATEQQNDISHLAHTTLNIWIADRDIHSIPILIHQNPIQLSNDQLKQYSSKLAKAINDSTILLLSLRFHYLTSETSSSPMIVRDSTVAEFVAINRKSPSIYSWNSIKSSIRDLDIDGMSLFTGAFSSLSPSISQSSLMSSEASLTLLAVIFFLLLTFIMTILGCILCYYRKKFRKEKKNLVEAKIAAATLNRGAPIRHWSPYLERPPELLWERSTTATVGSTTPETYSVQEMKIAVN
uniref:Cadherin domain-containing protein n=1 Tax=Panagrolaimus sp. PS1159 TaxID=55785 RepID=A0AC35GU53_9BILA